MKRSRIALVTTAIVALPMAAGGFMLQRREATDAARLFAQRREACAAAASAVHQGLAERGFAFAQQAPCVPIAQSGGATCRRQRAAALDSDQQRSQSRHERRAVRAQQLPMRVDGYLEH